MSKKEICLAQRNQNGEYKCLITPFTSEEKDKVLLQCPCRDSFSICVEAFDEKKKSTIDSTKINSNPI